jgi:hypothetical protein
MEFKVEKSFRTNYEDYFAVMVGNLEVGYYVHDLKGKNFTYYHDESGNGLGVYETFSPEFKTKKELVTWLGNFLTNVEVKNG